MFSGKKDDAERSPGTKRGIRVIAIFTALGWALAALLIADKIYAENLNASLQSALVRSHAERHELSQELERLSGEVETLQNRLSRYQNREKQAAVNP